MKEDDNHIIKVERKPFFGSLVTFLFLFGTFFITLIAYMTGNVLISLSILAFAVIILLLIRRGIRKNKIIVSDFRENKEPKVALNKKNENISKNTDVLIGKKETEVALNEDNENISKNTDVLRGKEETKAALNEDNENHIRFITRIRIMLVVWFFSIPLIIFFYNVKEVSLSLSVLAFAVIISLAVVARILSDGKENLSKNINILKREKEEVKEEVKEEAEVALNDSINIPENYIPKTEPKKPVGYYSFLSYDMRDLYREIVELIILSIILILMLPWLSKSYFDDQSHIGFFYSFLLCIIAFWKFRTVYFKKGWVKVLAKPNNVLEEQFSGGGGDGFVPTDVIVTEGWTFFVDGQQYNIKKPSSIHYKKEREIYWHPITNNLIVRNWPAKVLLFLYLFAANIFFNVGLALLLNQPTDEVYITNLIVLFGLVLPTSVIILSEMYINKKTLEDIIAFLILSALGFAVLYLASLVLG